jgi:hypothetical protein
MKFGLLLEQAMRADWAANYVNYKVQPSQFYSWLIIAGHVYAPRL